MNNILNVPQNMATNKPLSASLMQLLSNQYSSRANIGGTNAFGGVKMQTRCLIPRTHMNHRISAELQTDTMKYKNNVENGSESYERKPRFLCLHGFRLSGEIFKKQIDVKWPTCVREKLDLVYVDAPFPCQGKSDVEKFFDPPYYEWAQFIYHEDHTEYANLDESIAYVENCMLKYGPFDGLLGFSQGAALSALVSGLQANGFALTKVPKIKNLILMGATPTRDPAFADKAFSSKVQCSSLHLIGEKDHLKLDGIELLESFVDPVMIFHSKGHAVPRLDEKNLRIMEKFIEKIQKEVNVGRRREINMTRDYSLASP